MAGMGGKRTLTARSVAGSIPVAHIADCNLVRHHSLVDAKRLVTVDADRDGGTPKLDWRSIFSPLLLLMPAAKLFICEWHVGLQEQLHGPNMAWQS